MRSIRTLLDALGSAGAASNALVAVERHRDAMAEIDDVVDRLHRHAAGRERPAA